MKRLKERRFKLKFLLAATVSMLGAAGGGALGQPATQAVVVRQSAVGYSTTDLDLLGLQNLERLTVDEAVDRAKANLRQSGHDPAMVTRDLYASDSYLVEIGGNRFGLVKMSAGGFRMKIIMTIRSEEFIKVSCFRTDSGEVLLASGPCAEQLRQTFGIVWPAAL